MDLVTDSWTRRCIGLAIVIIALGCFALFATPMVNAIRWW